MLDKILRYSFYLLFVLTPLAWYSGSFELFEYNKMMLVYFLTVVITATWLVKMVHWQKLFIKRTPLDLPLGLFLVANVLSTIFSIDLHTSVWGYYSRSNGGLLSLIAYLLLYWALVSNFQRQDVVKFLKAILLGGYLTALWAIPEHFGVSPSCILLTGQANASCWVQEVQARVFSTLGQPNWLAAYLAMLIFPTWYFILTAKTKLSLATYYLLLTTYFLAFTFTYSRGASLGLLAGLGVFGAGWLLGHQESLQKNWPRLVSSALILMSISLLFGSALYSFRLIKTSAPPPRPGLTGGAPAGGTQLESGGSETGHIRLIVWKGAWEIFKHYPLVGSGLETFAYSYYQYRPPEHNLTSEWDFLYNKAHNEYLNYLATTGAIGFISYLGLIGWFIFWSLKQLLTAGKPANTDARLLSLAVLAAVISYLVQNLFSFSVVMITLLFFLLPALTYLYTDQTVAATFPKPVRQWLNFFLYMYKRPLYKRLVVIFLVASGLYLLVGIINYHTADTYYEEGTKANAAGNPGRAYNFLTQAVQINPREPLYRSDLAFAASGASVALADTDATVSAQLQSQAVRETQAILKTHPKNVSLLRTAVRTYYLLSTLNKSYVKTTLDTIDQAILLAPTDPKLTYNKAVIEGGEGQIDQAIADLRKTIELKPDYRDAHYALALFLFQQKQTTLAMDELKTVLTLNPGDVEAADKFKTWATASGVTR